MTVLQRVLPARIPFKPVVRFRNRFHRSLHHHVNSAPTTTTRSLTDRQKPRSFNSWAKQDLRFRYVTFNRPKSEPAEESGEDDVWAALREADVPEEQDGTKTTSGVTVSSARQEEGLPSKEEVGNEQAVNPNQNVRFLGEQTFRKAHANSRLVNRNQQLVIVFSQALNSLGFTRSRPIIVEKLAEFTKDGLLPECLDLNLDDNKFCASALRLEFQRDAYIPPEAKYPDFWTGLFGRDKVYEVHNNDDYLDWVQLFITESPRIIRGKSMTKEELQTKLREANPGIFDDQLPREKHPFACFLGNTYLSSTLIRVQIPPHNFGKVLEMGGLRLHPEGAIRPLRINPKTVLSSRAVTAAWWHAPNAVGRDNEVYIHNFKQKATVLDALLTVNDINNPEERRRIAQYLKGLAPLAEEKPPEPVEEKEEVPGMKEWGYERPIPPPTPLHVVQERERRALAAKKAKIKQQQQKIRDQLPKRKFVDPNAPKFVASHRAPTLRGLALSATAASSVKRKLTPV